MRCPFGMQFVTQLPCDEQDPNVVHRDGVTRFAVLLLFRRPVILGLGCYWRRDATRGAVRLCPRLSHLFLVPFRVHWFEVK